MPFSFEGRSIFIWLAGVDEVALGFGYGYVLEKVSVEYRRFWAVLVGNAH